MVGSNDYLDTSEFLKNDIIHENMIRTKRILGVFEDELYCYLTGESVDTPAIEYFLDKINKEQKIDTVVVSEITSDQIQTMLVEYFTKHHINFRFVADYDAANKAYMVIIAKKDIRRDPIKFKTDIPYIFINNFGKPLCKKCMKEIAEYDKDLVNYYKKEPLFGNIKCYVCTQRKEVE